MRRMTEWARALAAALLAMAVLMTLAGCTNLFQDTYVDRLGEPVADVPGLEHDEGVPRLIRTSSLPEDVRKLVEEGYVMIGFSRFNAEAVDASQAVEWGRKQHAQIVLLSQVYTNTEIDAVPVTYWYPPVTVTGYYGRRGFVGRRGAVFVGEGVGGYAPVAVYRYNYDASYWVKETSPVLGARVYDLTPALRQQLQRNKGAVVYAVVKGSPAWDAGLLEGDVITQLGPRAVDDATGLQVAVDQLAGQKVEIKIIRGGRERTLAVTLRPGVAPPVTAPATQG